MDWGDLQTVYDQLGSYQAVANHYGVSIATVQTRMKQYGVTAHPKILERDWSQLAAKYEELGTYQALAEYFQCSVHAVQRAIKREGIAPKQRGLPKGYAWSEERRAAHRAVTNTPEWAEKSRENLLKRLPAMSGSSANSPLEKLLHGALLRAGISFTTQRQKLGKYVVDIELTQAPVIIEADGSRHHLPPVRERDACRDAELTTAGYRVFRFSGTEINQSPDHCIRSVIDTCGLVPEHEPSADIRTALSGADHPWWTGGPGTFTCSWCGVSFQKVRAHRTCVKTFCCQQCYFSWLRAHPEELSVQRRFAKMRRSETMIQSELVGDGKSEAEMTSPA